MLSYLHTLFKDQNFSNEWEDKLDTIDVLKPNENDEVVACWEVEVRHGNWQAISHSERSKHVEPSVEKRRDLYKQGSI